MTLPLIVLSIFSVGLGGLLSMNDAFAIWLEPVTGRVEHGEPVLPAAVIMAPRSLSSSSASSSPG